MISKERVLLWKFYLTCILSSWGDRSWFFALSIYFITINKNSLLMTAVNGLTSNIFLIFFGPLIGSTIDKYDRLKVVRVSLLVQNATVAINCCLIIIIMLYRETFDSLWNGHFPYFFQAIIIIANVISNASSMANKIAIEKDWVIVISKYVYNLSSSSMKNDQEQEAISEEQIVKRQKSSLASINATVRRFDLATAILSPLVAGIIMSFTNMSVKLNGIVLSAFFFAAWNVASFFAEYYLLASVYHGISDLRKIKKIHLKETTADADANAKKSSKNYFSSIKTIFSGWNIYMTQGWVLLPSLVLSILFLTVLSFDSITIGYAKSQKLTETFISILQGFGSLFGVLGTIAYPLLHNKAKLNLKAIGLISFTCQLSLLFVCFVAIWLPGSPFILANKLFNTNENTCQLINNTNESIQNLTFNSNSKIEGIFFDSPCHKYTSIIVLLSAMAVSRFGLWLSDLVLHQIIQENVDENKRGIVGGVQNSMNKIFDTAKYLCVLALSNVNQYGYLVIVSVSAVFVSYCLFISYAIATTCHKRYAQVPVNEAQAEMEHLQKVMVEETEKS